MFRKPRWWHGPAALLWVLFASAALGAPILALNKWVEGLRGLESGYTWGQCLWLPPAAVLGLTLVLSVPFALAYLLARLADGPPPKG